MLFHPQSKGFTVIELLAVVAIVGLLMTMVYLMGRGMIRKAHAATCAHNLRVLGNALYTYLADNDGRFPPSRNRVGDDGNGNGIGQNFYIFSAYFGGNENAASDGLHPIQYFNYPKPSGAEMQKPGKSYKDAGIFWCPADNDPKLRPLRWASQSYADNAFYVGGEKAFRTSAVTGQPNAYEPSSSRLAAVLRPGEIIYAIDHVDIGAIMLQSPVTASSWPFPVGSPKDPDDAGAPPSAKARVAFDRHNGIANALFLDGSVKALTYENLAGTGVTYLVPWYQK